MLRNLLVIAVVVGLPASVARADLVRRSHRNRWVLREAGSMRIVVGLLTVLLLCPVVAAQNFSVAIGTPDTAGGFPPGDDILLPGPAPILPGSLFGIDVNGFSYGRFRPIGPTVKVNVRTGEETTVTLREPVRPGLDEVR